MRMTRERRQSPRCPHLCKGPRFEFESRASHCSRGCGCVPAPADSAGFYAENELPQPQPPVAVGFLNVNPEPCIELT